MLYAPPTVSDSPPAAAPQMEARQTLEQPPWLAADPGKRPAAGP